MIAGQGTCAREIFQDCRARGVGHVDSLLICCGGGGLTAGCNLVAARDAPGTKVYAVEPAGYDDHVRSLASGRIEGVQGNPPSICDALQAAAPGNNTFPINKRLLAGAFAVTDDEVRYAMLVAFETLQLVLEPSGAAALAALLAGRVDAVGKTTAVVASGGNLTYAKFKKLLGNPAKIKPSGHGFDWTGFRPVCAENIADQGSGRPLVVVRGPLGALACGFVSVAGSDAVGEAVAIVKGVSKPEDMLAAKVVGVSKKAKGLGVRVGMKGREALERMRARRRSKL